MLARIKIPPKITITTTEESKMKAKDPPKTKALARLESAPKPTLKKNISTHCSLCKMCLPH